jgi:hypothetical protein
MRVTRVGALFAATAMLAGSGHTPAHSHEERGLDAGIVGTTTVFCDFGGPICRAEGRVRATNDRARGTGPVVFCIGIEMHTAAHRNLSLEPPTVAGQAVTTVRPGRSRTTSFKTVYDESAGRIDHVHVVHTHRHVVQGGRTC